jgi:hypothetical protein
VCGPAITPKRRRDGRTHGSTRAWICLRQAKPTGHAGVRVYDPWHQEAARPSEETDRARRRVPDDGVGELVRHSHLLAATSRLLETTLFPVLLSLAPAASLAERFPEALESLLKVLEVNVAFVASERWAMSEASSSKTAN